MTRVVTLPRVLGVLAVLVLLGAALLVLFVNASSQPSCVGGHSSNAFGAAPPKTGLSASSSASLTTLPPSHDNDAGRSRIPDVTPDADNDVYRARVVCTAP